MSKRLASRRCTMPPRYKQSRREAKRAADMRFFASLGPMYVSRHTDDPEGSQRWVETGSWEAPHA